VGLIKERSGETASEVEGKLRDISTRSDGCEKMLRMTDR
jgi:hypothetical protein